MWRKQEQPKSAAASEVAVDSALGAPQAPGSETTAKTVSTPNAPTTSGATPSPQATLGQSLAHAPASASRLTGALKIKGEITGKEDLLIDAQLEGRVYLDGGTVTVGTNGRVTANIEAGEIVVAGHVKGSLRGRERVHVTPTGRTNGEIVSRRVSIEAGAEVDGSVEVTRVAESPAPRAAAAASVQAAAPRSAPSVQPVLKEPSAAA